MESENAVLLDHNSHHDEENVVPSYGSVPTPKKAPTGGARLHQEDKGSSHSPSKSRSVNGNNSGEGGVTEEMEELRHSMTNFCMRCLGRVPVVRQALPQIHEGFLVAYLSIRGQLFASIKQSFDKWGYSPIYATGHSLGGALAMLAAYDLKINFNLPVVVYSYGAPRVGNFTFATMYNSHVPATFRVVVDGDVIVGMPKYFGRYRHAGIEVLIDAETSGNLIVRPSVVENSLLMRNRTSATNHSLTTYRDCLEACFSPEDLREYLPKVSSE